MQIINKDMDYQLKVLKKQLIAKYQVKNASGIILKDINNNYSIHEYNYTKTKLTEKTIKNNKDNIKQYDFLEYIIGKQYKTYTYYLKET